MTSTLTSTDSNNIPFVKWLVRKKISTLSFRSNTMNTHEPFQPNVSTLSLPLSLMTSCSSSSAALVSTSFIVATTNSNVETARNQYSDSDKPCVDTQPPPSYDDPSHPWIFSSPAALAIRTVYPREEEGQETLPVYECTLNKVACVHVKCEYLKHNIKARHRPWRDLYIQVYGTKIMAFQKNPLKSTSLSLTTALSSLLSPSTLSASISPVWSYSMQNAEVQIATDYIKYHHVLRLRINQGEGPQFLFTFKSQKDKFDWLFALESSIDISSDIDVRPMPKATTAIHRTSGRRRRRRQRELRATATNDNTGR